MKKGYRLSGAKVQNRGNGRLSINPRNKVLQDTEENFKKLFCVLIREHRCGIHKIRQEQLGQMAAMER